MTTNLRRSMPIVLTCATAMIAPTPLVLAGDLNPPPGPVAPTMKSLDDLAPGICINDLPGDASAVHLIDQPGNYVLSGHVLGQAAKHGIGINLAVEGAVILDLNGFQLTGVVGSLDAIHGNGGGTLELKIVIKSVSPAIDGWDGDGIEIIDFSAVTIEGVDISNCGGAGITVTNTRECTIVDLAVSNHGGSGIDVTAAPGGPFKFSTKEGNLLSNTGPGIRVDISGTTSATIRVNDTTCTDNASHGIHVLGTGLMPQAGAGSATVAHEMGHNFSTDNGGDGIRVELDATASPSLHCVSSTLRGNVGDGLRAQYGDHIGAITYVGTCDASWNQGAGVRATGDLTIDSSTLNDNIGDGLAYADISPRKKKIRVESSGFARNGGSGAAITLGAASLGGTIRVSESSFDDNTGYGCFLDDDSDGDVISDMDECNASGNGFGGVVEDHLVSATAKKSTRVRKGTAHTNAGPGFSVTNARTEFIQCAAEDNTGSGFDVLADLASFRECTASGNTAHGYTTGHYAGGAARASSMRRMRDIKITLANYAADYGRCIASGNGLNGFDIDTDLCRIDQCSASGNNGNGISAQADQCQIRASTSSSNDGAGLSMSGGSLAVEGLQANENGSHGVHLLQGDGTILLAGGNCSNNTGDGVRILDLTGTLTVSGTTICGNAGHGLSHSSSIGIPAASVSIDHCVCSNNTLSGISLADSFGGRVEHCTAFSNGASGIEVLSFSHVVTNNMCGNNAGANLSVALPGNAVGSLVDETNIATEDNTTANYAP